MYDSLKEGDVVSYDVEEGDKGLAAVNVKLA
jgi:cold shock CspA family protein